MNVILCVGDNQVQHEKGYMNRVNVEQLENVTQWISPADWMRVVICYEPIWEHADGATVFPMDAQKAHINIRDWVRNVVHEDIGQGIRIIYGGHVDPDGATEFIKQQDIDGFLVGEAMAQSVAFADIVDVCNQKQ